MSSRKPFTRIMLCMQLDYHDGLRLNTDLSGLDTSDYTGPRLNADDVNNRRALYAIAGKLATFGYDVEVQTAVWYEVRIKPTIPFNVEQGEQWELYVRQCVDNACKELGLEYIG